MEIDNPEIQAPLEKVLAVIQRDRTLLNKKWKTEINDDRITAQNLGDLAGNHLFDDYPELFGITESQAHKLRSYLTGMQHLNDPKGHIRELYARFPEIMEGERPEFLQGVNNYRASQGLDPISVGTYKNC